MLLIGDNYFEHRGMRICQNCTKKYAWMLFEEEAKKKTVCGEELIFIETDI